MKIMGGFFLFCLMLQGCTGFTAAGVHKQEMIGRDVDQVISELKSKGFTCRGKYQNKVVNTGELSGLVNCGIKENALMCPKSYGVYLGYELSSNKVDSFFKDERTNCF